MEFRKASRYAFRMQPTPLEHPHFQVMPRESKKLVIFFSSMEAKDKGFWTSAAKRGSASVILINDDPSEWHQRGVQGLGSTLDETVSTIRRWADHLGATRLYTAGAAGGGFGALLYGARLGASILAFAPTARPSTSMAERLHLPELLEDAVGYTTVIAGESDPVDLLAVAQFVGIHRVNVTSLRRVTHAPLNYLKARKRLFPLIDAFIEDRRLPDFEEEGMGAHTKGFPEALHAAYCADKDNRFTDTEKYAARALALYPESELAMSLLGKSIMLQDRPKQALPFLKMAVNEHSRAENRFLWGMCLMKVGRQKDAANTFNKMIDKYPERTEGYYGLSQIYEMGNDLPSAISMINKAISIDGNDVLLAQKLKQLKTLSRRDGR
ncbi:tetratricopeptide repeat protein [Brevundimonas diminuta]|uniref:tetratricopeptide repeat protein n=1 Tax=Brevundimonas diminuta TaxID=293 RepID=UPI00320B1898